MPTRPAKVNHFGEELLGPTLIAYGSAEQQQRFLPNDPRRDRAVVPGLLGSPRRGQRHWRTCRRPPNATATSG